MTVGVKKGILLPEISEKEVARYAGGELPRTEIDSLASPAVCFAELPIIKDGENIKIGGISISSRGLIKNLSGCEKVLLFCATVGASFDREALKYSRLSPSRAVAVSAVGTERVEALCDAFLDWYKEEYSVKFRPRFSPGYGDLPLELQREIFSLLEPEKRIGVTLNDSLLMSPTKSVTAFVGIYE